MAVQKSHEVMMKYHELAGVTTIPRNQIRYTLTNTANSKHLENFRKWCWSFVRNKSNTGNVLLWYVKRVYSIIPQINWISRLIGAVLYSTLNVPRRFHVILYGVADPLGITIYSNWPYLVLNAVFSISLGFTLIR